MTRSDILDALLVVALALLAGALVLLVASPGW